MKSAASWPSLGVQQGDEWHSRAHTSYSYIVQLQTAGVRTTIECNAEQLHMDYKSRDSGEEKDQIDGNEEEIEIPSKTTVKKVHVLCFCLVKLL